MSCANEFVGCGCETNPLCPTCGITMLKVIAFGLPMLLCPDPTCSTIDGFWSTPYTMFIAPIEGYFNEGFTFSTYCGPYWRALIDFIFYGHEDHEEDN